MPMEKLFDRLDELIDARWGSDLTGLVIRVTVFAPLLVISFAICLWREWRYGE